MMFFQTHHWYLLLLIMSVNSNVYSTQAGQEQRKAATISKAVEIARNARAQSGSFQITVSENVMNKTRTNVSSQTTTEICRKIARTPENISSEREVINTLNYVGFVGMYPILILLGSVSCGLTLSLLPKANLHSTAYLYVGTIAVTDILYLISRLTPVVRELNLQYHSISLKYLYAYFFSYGAPAQHLFYVIGTWVSVAFAVERGIVVCLPLKSRMICSLFRTKLTVATIVIFFMTANAVNFLRRVVEIVYDSINECIIPVAILTEIGEIQIITKITSIVDIVTIVIPMPVLLITNCFIILHVHKASKQRSEKLSGATGQFKGIGESRDSKEDQITRVLVWFVIVFCICNSFAVVSAVLPKLSYSGRKSFHFTTELFFWFSRIVVISRPILNFILYICCSKRLRHAMLAVISCNSN